MTLLSRSRPATSIRPHNQRKPLTVAIAIGALAGVAGWPVTSLALGLGPISGQAVIGEPLQLEIPLTGSIDRMVENECVSVQRTPDSIDADYFPRDLSARVDRRADAPRIQLASRAAVRQPLVEFRVFVSCGYNLSHDYILMAAPRNEPAPVAVAAPTQPYSAAIAATAGRPTGNSASSSPVSLPASRSNGLPDGIAGKNFVVGRDMTLEEVARLHFPGPLRQQRFMRWVVEANPQFFAGTKNLRRQKLPAGTELIVPDGVPPRRPGDHQGDVTPLGERIAPVTEDAPPKPAPQATRVPGNGATRSDTTGNKDRLVVGGGAARNMKEAIALIDQLTGMMEKQLEAQNTYTEKIQQLETSVGTLDTQLKTLETEGAKREAQWQAALQAEKTAREREAEQAWWNLLMAVGAGGLLGAGLMFAGRMLLAKRETPAEDALLEEAPEVEPPTPVASANIAKSVQEPPADTPLTEFGWDEDPRGKPLAPAKPSAPVAASKLSAPVSVKPVAGTPAVTPNQIDFELPAGTSTSAATARQDASDPATAAIELANIMTSMGLAESAAQTLVEHIRENPRESLPQWLKLLEIYRLNGNRSEFERSANELRQHFNVQPDDWGASGTHGRMSIESYPHIRGQIVKLWRTPECTQLLRSLLMDNREGTRVGFPAPVAEEILLLIAILNNCQ